MAETLIIFDFDKTIIDCDSDRWVIDELGAADAFDALLHTMPWNSLMDRMMQEIHSRGKTTADIAEALERMPLDPHVVSAVRSAHALGCDMRVVSDANVFFIEAVLKRHGIFECFTEVNTNPSFVDEAGRLRISPFHDSNDSSHGCPFCPPNMCKSQIVERIRDGVGVHGKMKVIYLGDGNGDYCPSLKLGEGDFLMPRKNFPLWDLIRSDPNLLKAEVHEWSDGEDMERILLQLVNRTAFFGNGMAAPQLLSVDCKTETKPASSGDDLPKALPVPL
ncbi:hypothetical protein HPP92_027917 [Vanilla planifolia]|uniref:Uncharacterized protein n=1 Tax=Vanilla planifolia TaxID=51239 RepID=A0A835U4P4_VANPL|nr:hypothetical protein HPP92_027917 [Vanilla planifolia]